MKEKIGYICGIFDNFNTDTVELLLWCKNHCSKLVVGVLSDALVYRLLNQPVKYVFEKRIAVLKQLSCVDDVVEVGWDTITLEKSFEKIKYNVCFYGSEYGLHFASDKNFCAENEIEFLSLPDQKIKFFGKSLKLLLDNSFDRDIVLFGTGNYFDAFMKEFGELYPPAYAIDNNKAKWGKTKNGIKIYNIEKLKEKSAKVPLVIICVKKYETIAQQLREMDGIDYRTLCCNDEFAVCDEAAIIIKEESDYLREAHRLLTITLVEFDRVCKKYKLNYFLIQGSLIGAVRHHGLIPWDDDVDVAMFRKDYEKLCEISKEEWADSDFVFVPPDKIGKNVFHDFMSRLVYKKEILKNSVFSKTQTKLYEYLRDRMVIDVFVLDYRSKDEAVHNRQTFILKTLYGLAMGHRERIDYNDYKGQTPFVQKAIKGLTFVGKFIPLSLIFSIYEKKCTKYNKKYSDSGFVFESNAPLCCLQLRLDTTLFGNGTHLKVYGHDIMVPEYYANYLEVQGYHNFMEYPSGNIRKPTHSTKCHGIMYNI